MQTACSLVTASARGTNASISGKGSRWKVPSRAATRTIFPLKNTSLIHYKFPSSFKSIQHFKSLFVLDLKLHLLAISSHQLTMSGKNWPSSIPITSNSLDESFGFWERFWSSYKGIKWDIHPAISCSSESLLAETAGSTWTKKLNVTRNINLVF